jgi:hypothetical protein
VISAYALPILQRVPAVTGLNFLSAILYCNICGLAGHSLNI